MKKYIPIAEDWKNTTHGDFSALAKSCANLIKQLPKRVVRQIIRAEEKRHERTSFGTYKASAEPSFFNGARKRKTEPEEEEEL